MVRRWGPLILATALLALFLGSGQRAIADPSSSTVEIISTPSLAAGHGLLSPSASAFADGWPEFGAQPGTEPIQVLIGTEVKVVAHIQDRFRPSADQDAEDGTEVTFITDFGSFIARSVGRNGTDASPLESITPSQNILALTISDADNDADGSPCTSLYDDCLDGSIANNPDGFAIAVLQATEAGTAHVRVTWRGEHDTLAVQFIDQPTRIEISSNRDYIARGGTGGDPDALLTVTVFGLTDNPIPYQGGIGCQVDPGTAAAQARLSVATPLDDGEMTEGSPRQLSRVTGEDGTFPLSLESYPGNLPGPVTVRCWWDEDSDGRPDDEEVQGEVSVLIADTAPTVALFAGWNNVAYEGAPKDVATALGNILWETLSIWHWDSSAQTWHYAIVDGGEVLIDTFPAGEVQTGWIVWVNVTADITWQQDP